MQQQRQEGRLGLVGLASCVAQSNPRGDVVTGGAELALDREGHAVSPILPKPVKEGDLPAIDVRMTPHLRESGDLSVHVRMVSTDAPAAFAETTLVVKPEEDVVLPTTQKIVAIFRFYVIRSREDYSRILGEIELERTRYLQSHAP